MRDKTVAGVLQSVHCWRRQRRQVSRRRRYLASDTSTALWRRHHQWCGDQLAAPCLIQTHWLRTLGCNNSWLCLMTICQVCSLSLSLYLSLSVSLCLSLSVSLYLCVCLSVYLSVCQSLYVFILWNGYMLTSTSIWNNFISASNVVICEIVTVEYFKIISS